MGKKNDDKKEEKQPDNSELTECRELVENLEFKYKRALADYQNLEKRVAEQRRETILSANRELLLRLLPILDTLELALKHEQNQTIQVSVNQFLSVLKAEGVTKIETIGNMFDPHLMEVIDTTEGEDGRVVEEVQPGYMLGERLLRAALVKVGRKKISEEN